VWPGVFGGPRGGWVTERREVVARTRVVGRRAWSGAADAGHGLQRGTDRIHRAVGTEDVRGRCEESVVEFKRDLSHLPSLDRGRDRRTKTCCNVESTQARTCETKCQDMNSLSGGGGADVEHASALNGPERA